MYKKYIYMTSSLIQEKYHPPFSLASLVSYVYMLDSPRPWPHDPPPLRPSSCCYALCGGLGFHHALGSPTKICRLSWASRPGPLLLRKTHSRELKARRITYRKKMAKLPWHSRKDFMAGTPQKWKDGPMEDDLPFQRDYFSDSSR